MSVDEPCAGAAYDYLELPLDAALALLRRGVPSGAVEWDAPGARVLLRVPPGSAEELPGLLEWLQWGGVELELTARAGPRCPGGPGCPTCLDCPPCDAAAGGPGTRCGSRGVAGWLRPPESEAGRGGVEADLVRLVSAAATECHRAVLHRDARRQPFAFSYASRMSAGTRPRSLTL
ncbi:hypothetical protein JJV70_19625 [Streptomyces sp. JJ66]|uniref:hypothetical protein n=1 Tax=Streptomyces sp. JJ66 TaxID=2803843 RepID=UPI001C58DAE0|nr:hypothetical protein [Streptomyces sp. JJ66]MBW1604272.1 hypothetical protein [Streptomyces sp. JJ66]